MIPPNNPFKQIKEFFSPEEKTGSEKAKKKKSESKNPIQDEKAQKVKENSLHLSPSPIPVALDSGRFAGYQKPSLKETSKSHSALLATLGETPNDIKAIEGRVFNPHLNSVKGPNYRLSNDVVPQYSFNRLTAEQLKTASLDSLLNELKVRHKPSVGSNIGIFIYEEQMILLKAIFERIEGDSKVSKEQLIQIFENIKEINIAELIDNKYIIHNEYPLVQVLSAFVKEHPTLLEDPKVQNFVVALETNFYNEPYQKASSLQNLNWDVAQFCQKMHEYKLHYIHLMTLADQIVNKLKANLPEELEGPVRFLTAEQREKRKEYFKPYQEINQNIEQIRFNIYTLGIQPFGLKNNFELIAQVESNLKQALQQIAEVMGAENEE